MIRCGYGTYVPGAPGAPAELSEEIALAEQAGLDAIFFSEHHAVDGYAPDPLTLAAYALARTTTMRAGTMPMVLPLRDPVLVAESAAMASFLSGGRLILGVGAGYLQQDFDQVGIPLEERGPRMDEGLAVLRGVWSGPFEHAGRFYKVAQRRAPLHRGPADPPVWIASSSPVGMRRAARLGPAGGLMLNSLSDGDEVQALVNEYRRACVKRGEEPGTIGVIRRGWFGGGEEGEAFLRTFEGQLRGAVNFAEYAKKPWVRDLASRRWVQDVTFTGEPEELAAALNAWCERVGVDYVMLKLHWGARDFGQLTEQLRRAERFSRAL